MIKKVLLTVFLVLAQTVVSGAIKTYNATSGNWNIATNWSPSGVPSSTDDVVIPSGSTVTMISTTVTIATFTIYGQLVLLSDISHIINTASLTVVSPSGSIKFDKKSDLRLPTSTPIQVNAGGLLGDCSNNNSIFIGTVEVAVCVGGGNTIPTFAEVMASGGFNIVNISPISSSVCGSGSFTFTATAIPSTAATIKWYDAASGGNLLQTGTPGNSNTFISPVISATSIYYADATIGAYTTPRKAVVATVNSLPSAPMVAPTQPTCTLSTGSIVLSDLPASGTWTLTRSPGAIQTIGTGTSTTISGLAPGSYTYTVFNGSCTSLASSSVIITSPAKIWNGSVSSDWNTAANWTPSGVPTSSNCVTIPSTLRASIISGTNFVAYANTVTLQNSGRLTVNPSNTLAVIDFVSAGSGFLVFENTASLVQINNVNNNSGFIDYKRLTTARQTDYTYWSSPVSPMTLGELYPLGGTFYSYEASLAGEDWSPFAAGTDMVAGKGYIANRGAAIPLPGPPPPPGLLDVIFTGVPNNGHYEINAVADRSYLLGNPYPSSLDANTFLNANAGVLNGTLYFWTHNTQIGIGVSDPGTGLYAYSGNDYATYNATGGVAATQTDLNISTGPAPSGSTVLGGNNSTPTGKIASGQGFFASTKTAITGSKIIYDNTMRLGVIDISKEDNSQFFKTKNPSKSTKPIEKNRIWLNLTNTQGAFKQTLIGYITDATNDYDDRFDGESFDGNEFVDFYSINQDKNLVIQGRALPFNENDEVPLGFRTTINGAFTINIDQVDGALTDQVVFIEDKLTNTVFDLKSGNYTFNTVAGTFDDRFVLRFKDNSVAKTLAAVNFDSLEKTVLVSNKNKQIKIDSAVERIYKVTVFDLLGRQIYQKTNVNSNELSITNLVLSQQTLLVKIALQNGNYVTKKIIY